MSSPTALYRRYRPDTFQDVIGQEHVTEPLMTALRKDRVNHAYLFSGPRGCGKTTSARILARCLNCEKGPTPEPCGVCPSCVELARGGSGSLDVIEIDAASHGGVDDARDLRERATFAPVRDRYKIFIIDEAHMVTSAGFNALLKIVEEPPEHIKFIFATTEPDKVIGTIRSRTHHYPFRLVPPEPLMAYLEKLCAAEHVAVEPGVLSLVVRAGGGSVRDSLSVLDQLMAGAGTGGIDYELAVALLGYTHASLLDDVVDAVAASDSGTVFRAVDRVIQTGHDPRRFVEDLLERFRDLIIVRALPDAAESILRGVPADQLARMRAQAQSIGAFELSRAADVTNAAFNEMTGATSPRLHLELLCARLMLPAADGDQGVGARLDRLERRLSFEGPSAGSGREGAGPAVAPAASAVPNTSQPASPAPARVSESAPVRTSSAPMASAPTSVTPAPAEPVSAEPASAETASAETALAESGSPRPASDRPTPPTTAPRAEAPAPRPAPAPASEPVSVPSASAPAPTPAPASAPTPALPPTPVPTPSSAAASGGTGSVEMFRRAWPEILETLTGIKRLTWILVSQNANVAGFDGRTLTLAFANSGSAGSFTRGDHPDNVRQAIQKVLGVDVQIDATTGGNGPSPVAAGGAEQSPKAPTEPPQRPRTPESPRPAESTGAAESPTTDDDSAAANSNPAPSSAPSAADVAWGLAPGPAQPASEESTAEESAKRVPAKSGLTGPRPADPGPADPSPAEPEPQPHARSQPKPPRQTDPDPRESPIGAAPSEAAPANPTMQRPAASAPTAPARSSSASQSADPYADIPYGDEEPPAEWDEPLPDDDGFRRPSSGGQAAAPVSLPTSPRPTPKASKGNAAGDPWSYARESAPGVWAVATETNIGSSAPPSARPAEVPSAPESASASYAPAAAQPPARTAPEEPTPQSPAPQPANDGGRQLSMYQRLSQKAAQEREPGVRTPPSPQRGPSKPVVEDIPSADDETVEQSGVFGRAAVERILGGKLIEERAHDGTVTPPR